MDAGAGCERDHCLVLGSRKGTRYGTVSHRGASSIVEQLVAGSIAGPRLQAVLLGLFGALGLVLACIGVYAVISYSVAQRVREMGIRLALGAAPNAIRAMVLREGIALASA